MFSDYKAVRDPTHGSWFIEEFILIAELFSHVTHLEDIVRQVSNQRIIKKAIFILQQFTCIVVDERILSDGYCAGLYCSIQLDKLPIIRHSLRINL